MNKNGASREEGRTPARNYDVLSPAAFLDDIEIESARAKKRVWTQAMYMNPGKVADRVCNILKSSASPSRGLDTRLHTDWFGQAITGGTLDPDEIPLIGSILHQSHPKQEKDRMYEDLESNGVSITITNKPTPLERIIPYRGRNHMKITIIDDIVYLGGINYGDEDITYKDFMVKLTEKDIVNTLASIFLKVEDNTLEDTTIEVNPETTIIVDGGKTGYSPILQTSVSAVSKADENIYHVSQFFPDGIFLYTLHEIHKDCKTVEVIVPKRNTFDLVFSFLNSINKMEMKLKRRQIPVVVLENMVHAKLTIVDAKLAIFGSHNMSEKGVQMKTAEIALLSSNAILVRNLQSYYNSLKYGNSI